MPDRRTRTRFVSGAVLLIASGLVFANTGRDALFVQGGGIYDLPKAYLGIAVLSGPLAFVVLGLLKVFGPRVVRAVLPIASAAALLAFSTVVHPGGGALMTSFFMFVPLAWGVVFSVSWLLAGDLLDGANRIEIGESYAEIGAAAILGGVVAGGAGRWIAPHVAPRVFLWLAAALLVLAAIVMAEAQRRYPAPMRPSPSGETAGLERVSSLFSQRYAWNLAAVGAGAGVVGVLVEFRFYLAAAIAEGGGREKAAFFANVYLVLNLVALAVQLWIVPRLFRSIGAGRALFVLPATLLGGAGGLAASASLFVASTVRATEGFLKKSVHRASWEQAYLPLPKKMRATAKLFVEGVTLRVAEGLAALGLLAWLYGFVGPEGELAGHSTAWLTLSLLLGTVFWLWSTKALSRRIVECEPDAERLAGAGLPLDG